MNIKPPHCTVCEEEHKRMFEESMKHAFDNIRCPMCEGGLLARVGSVTGPVKCINCGWYAEKEQGDEGE